MSAATQQSVNRAIITPQGEREVRIERVFNAPRSKVWRAFTQPELVAQWWGRGNKLVIERMEVERGGHWRFVEHSDNGEHGFEGRYREVRPEDVIEHTFEWDGMPGHVCVERAEFEDLGDGRTRVISTSMFFTQEDRDGMLQSGMEQGLNQSYEALDRLLERI
jgi:uncharacterized protein YndB with AHSA1/START domain